MRFSVLAEFFFAVLRFWMIFFFGFAVSNIPNAPLYNCFILQEQKSGLKDTVVFLKKNCPTMGLLTHPAQSLAISQALTKALCFCASENSLTALFGSYPQFYSCNRFRE